MAKYKSWDYSGIDNLDRDGICASQTPAAGGEQALTIDGAYASGGVATLDFARHVAVYSGSDIAARVFTVTGTDYWGNTISETITGVNAGTVAGTKNFKTVTEVTVDDDTGAAVEVGTYSTLETPWYPLDRFTGDVPVTVYGEVAGTLTWGLQFTFDNIRTWKFAVDGEPMKFDDDTLTGKTVSTPGSIATPVAAVRAKLTGLSGAGFKFYVYEVP